MTHRKCLLGLTLVLALVTSGPAAAEANGRSYALHTLDYRVAETLVWEICERNGGKSDKCQVQHSAPRTLNVHAVPEVHAQIVEMLSRRDRISPASLLFEIVLVRLVENGDDRSPSQLVAHQRRALEAIWEIFPNKRAEIIDVGLIRTAKSAGTRLGTTDGFFYEAQLAVRSTTGLADGLSFTVDLSIIRGEARILTSTLIIGEGETVVAGTSRTEAEDAVVVLLTSKSTL